ncbi:MAG: type II toxin-antitoxin system VapC family toxin [Gammaproteobacteria bacterium]|nr:type II toxin-antitoxin system VapC family toxin [Gammaproteobacteria bacterium]MBU1646205.1 type II toxin-antitoxin system VapC family toxin [Gammaproteobacteria bacterium]MBU1972267.1 type II toxin-antitoxin system VapC family toxin [Gammaproteobacteria bacterium]
MILVDTSVWIDHLRGTDTRLAPLLESGQVCVHPWVIGELACGNLANRGTVLGLLQSLPHARSATDGEALLFIERRQLMGRGIGYVDVHLLAACALDASLLLTRDKRLGSVADALGLSWPPGVC